MMPSPAGRLRESQKTDQFPLTYHNIMIYIPHEVIMGDLLDMQHLERAAEVMRVLAHPHRLRICELLISRRVSVGELAEAVQIPSNAVSQHLNTMKAHGLVERERDGKTVYYRVCDPRPCWILQCVRNNAQG
jgi:DNA-binding transcriptional ArsR family regulator